MRWGKLIALALPAATPVPLSAALGTAKALSGTLVDIPALSDIDMEDPDVPKMSEAERMMWVVLKCGEVLDKTGKAQVAAAFKQLLDPKVIGMVVAGLVVWGASHFVGVGFILDIAAVVVMGLAVLKAFEVMWDIYKIISGTAQKSDLERAAKMMADMVIDLGVETFLAIVLKGAAKSRFRAPPNKAAGRADEAVEMAPARRRAAAKEDAPTDKKTNKTKPAKPTETQLKSAKELGVDPKWVNPDGSVKWPPNDGFDGPSKTISLDPPAEFDRYGGRVDPDSGKLIDEGSFTSPTKVPFEQRAVPPATLKRPFNEYRVVKPIPGVKSGKIAPWFDQPGGGTQYKMPMNIDKLIEGGYIEKIGGS